MGVFIKIIKSDQVDTQIKLESLEKNVEMLRQMVEKDENVLTALARSRRNALSPSQYNVQIPLKENFTSFSEDGIPVVGREMMRKKKYKGFRKDSNGFRVYSAWYQHRRENKIKNDPRVVVQHATDAPIRPHHRKSAAWSERDGDDREDDFVTLGDSMYSDSAVKSSNVLNSVSFTRNRAKITNPKIYRDDDRHNIPTTTLPPPTSSDKANLKYNNNNNNMMSINEHMRDKITSAVSSSSVTTRPGKQEASRAGRRGKKNRMALKSGNSRGKSSGSSMMAIHLEGKMSSASKNWVGVTDGQDGGRVKLADGVFRDWTVPRWVKKMGMERQVEVNDGVVTVSKPGVYFIYAQVNYVDSQDVNAFQILVNDSEWLMCTTMTHTPGHTTKVNTCYTGGVRFLEAGDRVMVRNTDNDRYVVMLPSHSFFGIIQMSKMGN